MDTCTVEVQLGGSLNNTVVKRGITPAEIVCLKQMHGVKLLSVDGKIDRTRPEETKRLNDIYHKVMPEVYPGAAPMLPMSITDIGLIDPVQVAEQEHLQRQEEKEMVDKAVSEKTPAVPREAPSFDPVDAMEESEALQLAGSEDTEPAPAPKKRGRPKKNAD